MNTIFWQDKSVVDASDFEVAGNGVTDDTVNLQAAIDAAYAKKLPCYIPGGTYKITSTLRMYNTNGTSADGIKVFGAGPQLTFIHWYGDAVDSPFRIIAGNGELSHMSIINHGTLGWQSAVEYDGTSLARSTHSVLRQLFIDGNFLAGDGVVMGRNGFQADMLEIDHCYITHLTKGTGVKGLNGNVLSINLYACTIGTNSIGVDPGLTTNLNVFGGEYDDNDINFIGGTSESVISGIRTEGSKRHYWSNTGTYLQGLTFTGNWIASGNTTRPVTTGAIQNGQTALTLSVPGYVSGDKIDIAGAGPASGVLSTTILAITDTTHVTVANAASTTVTTGAISFTAGVIQPVITINAGGPYTFIGNVFSDLNRYAVSVPNGPTTFINNYWVANTRDPFGSVPGTTVFHINNATMIGNTYNGSASTVMPNVLGEGDVITLTANTSSPSILTGTLFITNNSSPTTISDFADGYNGKEITVLQNDSNTSYGGGGTSIKTIGGGTVTGQQNGIYKFRRMASNWWMIGHGN